MSIRKYKNPPVVEAWIDFRFEYGEESSDWNNRVAVDFVKCFDKFNQEEHVALIRKEIRMSKRGPFFSESAPELQRLKTFNATKNRCLQIEENLLVYNMIRKKDEEWPGFSVLLEEALPCCQKYIDSFHPTNLRVALHYRDHIVIPFVNDKIEPKDYFEIYPNVPEDKLGNMVDYSLSLLLTDICKEGAGRFSVRTEPFALDESRPQLPFIIDWDVQSVNPFNCEDLDTCAAWLKSAHEGINRAFEGCLTPKCRSLFDEVQS